MKKFLSLLLTIAFLLSFSTLTLARSYYNRTTERSCCFLDSAGRLNEQQKRDLISFIRDRNNLAKEYLEREVEAGRISREVAEARLQVMEEEMHKLQYYSFEPPSVSEEQRMAKLEYLDRLRALEIEHVEKAIASGSLSKERGQQILRRLEAGDYRGHGWRHGYGYRHTADCWYW